MKERTITIDKGAVLVAVAMAAEYAGAKKDDATAYERMALTDENTEVLEGYWQESKDGLCTLLREVVEKESEDDTGRLTLTLRLPEGFDDALLQRMEHAAQSFVAAGMTSKWYAVTSKEDSAEKAAEAAAHAEVVKQVLYKRKRPERPTRYDKQGNDGML